MPSSSSGHNGWRTQPMYSFSEVAHLAHVSVSTVRNWLLGYTTATGEVGPLIKSHQQDDKACSFLELIEIVVAASFRKAEHKSFKTVRKAYDNARRIYNLDFPFASMELKGIGGHIVHIMRIPEASLQAIDQPEQFTLPGLVQQILDEQIEYELDLASKWWPVGKGGPIVIDPRVSSGLPVVKDRGITVDAIHRRFKNAEQPMDFIARDFDLDLATVEEVIRYVIRSAEKVAV